MILAESGRLDYDDAVARHVMDFPYEDVSIRHLLNHTAGVPDYEKLFRDGGWPPPYTLTKDVLLNMFRERVPGLEFTPGAQYAYSNTGYVFLATVVEAVSGMSYADFLRESVWGPSGMVDSFDYAELRLTGGDPRVLSYDLRPTGEVERVDLDHDLTWGSSGLCSSAGDLFRFDQALYGQTLVSNAALEQAFSPPQLADGTTSDYGFGWEIWADGAIVLHSGGSAGIRALLIRYVKSEKTLIILENHTDGNFSDIAGALMNILAGEPYELPSPKTVARVDPSLYEEFVGVYGFESGFSIMVTTENDRLYAKGKGQQNFEIFPKSESEYFYTLIDAEITFIKDENGTVTGLILHQGGEDSSASRIAGGPSGEP
jgi:CubicO group peptidase (beta-lactamase class C family)